MKFSECELGKIEIENEKRFGVKITFDWFKTYEDVKDKTVFNVEFSFRGFKRNEQFNDIQKLIYSARSNGCIRAKVVTA